MSLYDLFYGYIITSADSLSRDNVVVDSMCL